MPLGLDQNGRAVLTWIGTTVGSVLSGRSSKTSGEEGSAGTSSILESLIVVGPYVYIFGLDGASGLRARGHTWELGLLLVLVDRR